MISRWMPFLQWTKRYNATLFADDLLAAVIVTVMLIPQSLAYAMIAGLPPQAGLYASIAPLVAYAIFGTSRTLSVGPVAVVSLLTATAIGKVAVDGTVAYTTAALALACLTGLFSLALGILRFGFIANFLSHPTIAGFISASGVLIAVGQVKHLLGVTAHGESILATLQSIISHITATNVFTLAIGCSVLVFLWLARAYGNLVFAKIGAPAKLASALAKSAPLIAVAGSIAAVQLLGLADKGVAIIGDIPGGLPAFSLSGFDISLWRALAGPAALIALIGYVESVSVAQTLAAKRKERIDLNQELIGLGAANIAAGVSGGFPVTGGFSRSVVNFDAGARTPAASALTALGIALATMYLTPFLFYLPNATLGATIIIAVLSLIDIKQMRRTWRYSKSDFAAMAITMAGVFFIGVETGVIAGVLLSVLLLLYRASQPHYAIVGQVPGTEHFRNIHRHKVIISPSVASIRIDGNLFFANARFLEDAVIGVTAETPNLKHFVLMCSAVNEIDASALESLETINERLEEAGVTFHLSEVKGPVMDRLKRSNFLDRLTGQIFLSQFDAAHRLDPETFHMNGDKPAKSS